MRNLIVYFIFVFIPFNLWAQPHQGSMLYVGTFTSESSEGIYLCRFDDSTGKITLQKTFKGIDNPSFLRLSPDGNYLYAVTRAAHEIEPSGGYIQAYRTGSGGDLFFLNKQLSNGADPCHIDVSPDGKLVAIATYGGGTVSVYPVLSDGSLDKAGMTIYNKGKGPNQARQNAPHAHSVLFSPDGKQLFSADLGTDKISIFDVQNGKIISSGQSYLNLDPGAGPRHITFHPNGQILYVINELNSTITSFMKNGRKWKKNQSISTLPDDFNGENYCADIHVSADGRFVYGSNRGHNSIAVFSTDTKSKKLNLIATVPTQGDWPRNFTLSEDGKYLLAANQRSGNIAVFRISENGIPEFTGNEVRIPAPVCLILR